MNISLRAINNLSREEIVFVFAMMQKYGGLDKAPNRSKNNKKRNNHKPRKQKNNHDKCSTTNPCLYDFNCSHWDKCEDEKFLQYRLIMQKCENKK